MCSIMKLFWLLFAFIPSLIGLLSTEGFYAAFWWINGRFCLLSSAMMNRKSLKDIQAYLPTVLFIAVGLFIINAGIVVLIGCSRMRF